MKISILIIWLLGEPPYLSPGYTDNAHLIKSSQLIFLSIGVRVGADSSHLNFDVFVVVSLLHPSLLYNKLVFVRPSVGLATTTLLNLLTNDRIVLESTLNRL